MSRPEKVGHATPLAAMSRIERVIAEVNAAREEATRKFAEEVNMPLADFHRHFRVVLELSAGDEPTVSFRVEPREEGTPGPAADD